MRLPVRIMRRLSNFLFVVAPFAILLLAFSALFLKQGSMSAGLTSSATLFAKKIVGRKDMKSESPQDGLKLIGCGLARTGTSSAKAALERFGYKAYHGSDLIRFPNHFDMWVDAMIDPEENLSVILEEIFRLGYNATTPGILSGPFCLELWKRFPEAKVLLIVRDNEQEWVESFKAVWNSIAPIIDNGGFPLSLMVRKQYLPLFRESMNLLNVDYELTYTEPKYFWSTRYSDAVLFKTDEDLKRAYLELTERVKKEVPETQLLEYNVRQGWKPLLKFLGEGDFDEDSLGIFPHTNSRRVVRFTGKFGRFVADYYPLLFLLMILYLVYLSYSCKFVIGYFLRSKDEKKTKKKQ